jgi:hypothetical protein
MIDKRKRKLLVIECNTPKLKAQSLSFSEALIQTASLVLPNSLIHLIRIKDKELTPTQFAEAKQISDRFSSIAIIGHSNSLMESGFMKAQFDINGKPFQNGSNPSTRKSFF